ncbi:hypothetical protein N0V86_006945 [Didymella sp. IMI 355093]|nr:hypothetical protein N0V86_006945 [Didymella sp. IMI 355093]
MALLLKAVRARNELEFPEIDEPTKILRLLNVLLGLNFQGMNAQDGTGYEFTPSEDIFDL